MLWAEQSKQDEVKRMKKLILAMASLGMISMLISLVPDIRRYLRIRSM